MDQDLGECFHACTHVVVMVSYDAGMVEAKVKEGWDGWWFGCTMVGCYMGGMVEQR